MYECRMVNFFCLKSMNDILKKEKGGPELTPFIDSGEIFSDDL